MKNHIAGHGIQTVSRFPVPLLSGAAVIHAVGPGSGDSLPYRVYFVSDTEVWNVLTNFSEELFGLEAHGCNVEGVAVLEAGGIGLHELDGGMQGVGHVHHVHEGAGGDGADEFLPLDG